MLKRLGKKQVCQIMLVRIFHRIFQGLRGASKHNITATCGAGHLALREGHVDIGDSVADFYFEIHWQV